MALVKDDKREMMVIVSFALKGGFKKWMKLLNGSLINRKYLICFFPFLFFLYNVS